MHETRRRAAWSNERKKKKQTDSKRNSNHICLFLFSGGERILSDVNQLIYGWRIVNNKCRPDLAPSTHAVCVVRVRVRGCRKVRKRALAYWVPAFYAFRHTYLGSARCLSMFRTEWKDFFFLVKWVFFFCKRKTTLLLPHAQQIKVVPWTIDVKTEKSWRVKRRHWCHLIGLDYLIQRNWSSPHKNKTARPADAFEDTALKPLFEIVKF